MKYLQDYMNERQSALFEETGAFFAFSQKQFDEQKKPGVKYVNCGMGMLCPKDSAKALFAGLDAIYKASIQQDIEENGLNRIIIRELNNHEAYYTGSIEDTARALKDYPVTEADILAVYKNKNHELEQIVPAEEVPNYPTYTPEKA